MDAKAAAEPLAKLNSDGLSHWGFILYRTDYHPEHEAQWAELLKTIHQSTFEKICNTQFECSALPTDASHERKLQQQVWEAFKLDVRSDKGLYDGVGIDMLRKTHMEGVRSDHEAVMINNEGEEKQQYNMPPVQAWVFLLADTDVLTEGLQKGWIKVVDAQYTAEQYESNRRYPRSYWGWMKMELGVSERLWGWLEMLGEMYDFAPRSYEGEYAASVFDGEMLHR